MCVPLVLSVAGCAAYRRSFSFRLFSVMTLDEELDFSAYSTPVTVFPEEEEAPNLAVPSNLEAENDNDPGHPLVVGDWIELTWSNSNSNGDGYVIEISRAGEEANWSMAGWAANYGQLPATAYFTAPYDPGAYRVRVAPYEVIDVQGEDYGEIRGYAAATETTFTVYPPVDLDVDSDNTNGADYPDRNQTEEDLEDEEGRPGKVIAVGTEMVPIRVQLVDDSYPDATLWASVRTDADDRMVDVYFQLGSMLARRSTVAEAR